MSIGKANESVKPMFSDTIEVCLTILKVDITNCINCEVTRPREQCTNEWEISWKESVNWKERIGEWMQK